MTQSMTQLPETADIEILGWYLTIRDHMFVGYVGLLGSIIDMISVPNSDRDVLCQFEKYKVSFEAAIDCCTREIKDDVRVLSNIIFWNYDVKKTKDRDTFEHLNAVLDFLKSAAGRKIAEQFIDKINNCDNWRQLYDEMHLESKFQKDMKSKIIAELEL